MEKIDNRDLERINLVLINTKSYKTVKEDLLKILDDEIKKEQKD